jgi:hypothetical protein
MAVRGLRDWIGRPEGALHPSPVTPFGRIHRRRLEHLLAESHRFFKSSGHGQHIAIQSVLREHSVRRLELNSRVEMLDRALVVPSSDCTVGSRQLHVTIERTFVTDL